MPLYGTTFDLHLHHHSAIPRWKAIRYKHFALPQKAWWLVALYLISYDIKSYDKNEYPELYAKLEEIGAEKILFSEWIVIGDAGKAISIYTEIAPCIKMPDRLLVQELTRDAQWDKLLMSNERFKQFLTHARG